jgi:hypothetical protein
MLDYVSVVPGNDTSQPKTDDDLRLEQAVLGAIVSCNGLLNTACVGLEPDHFAEPLHRQLFGLMADIIRQGRRADPRTLNAALPKNAIAPNGLTPSRYIARCAAERVSERPQDVQLYVREIILLAWKRASRARVEDWLDLLASGQEPDLAGKLREAAAEIEATAPSIMPEIQVWDAGDDPEPSKLPPREWMMATQFCKQFISGVIGPGGVGKTSLRILQFIAMAIGRELTGHHVFRRCRVLIVGLEDSRTELQRRIAAACIHHRIPKRTSKGGCVTSPLRNSKG